MKPIQMIEVLKRFNFRCALTDSENYHIEHWLPQVKGGKTTVENCNPLDAELNLKKGKQNPFVFFEREDIRCRFEKERFEELVFWLAINNDLSVEEFRDSRFGLTNTTTQTLKIGRNQRGGFEYVPRNSPNAGTKFRLYERNS